MRPDVARVAMLGEPRFARDEEVFSCGEVVRTAGNKKEGDRANDVAVEMATLRAEGPVPADSDGEDHCTHFVPLQPRPDEFAQQAAAPKKSLFALMMSDASHLGGAGDWQEVRLEFRDASDNKSKKEIEMNS